MVCPAVANPDAKRLYDDLLSHYNRLIRPVSNNSEVVTVRLGLHLSQLIDLVSAVKKRAVHSITSNEINEINFQVRARYNEFLKF